MKTFIKAGSLCLATFFVLACGTSTGSTPEPGASTPPEAQQKQKKQAFKPLSKDQIGSPCQWLPQDAMKEAFKLTDEVMQKPQDAQGFTYMCTQLAKGNNKGLNLSWQLTPFEDEEVYNASLEAAQMGGMVPNAKKISLGREARFSHHAVAANRSTSILQMHGSNYALSITAEYQGVRSADEIEKAIITMAKIWV
ncbi:MAG TPA: hypothetical protein PKD90_17825, partial [Phnomibacter sp.]|nr:hypothetical protein [Phnomibacter sp.]